MTTKQNLGVAVLLAASTVLTPLAASAQGVSDDVIRIGIMNDQSDENINLLEDGKAIK